MRKLVAVLCAVASLALAGNGALAQKGKATRPAGLKLPPLPPSTDDFLVAQLADARWMPAQKMDAHLPAGMEVALIGADPMSTGITAYLRMKAGYKLPAHAHIHIEWLTMLSGKGEFTVAGKRVPSTAGTYLVIPSKAKHDFVCDAGAECVFVMRRSGPTEYIWPGK